MSNANQIAEKCNTCKYQPSDKDEVCPGIEIYLECYEPKNSRLIDGIGGECLGSPDGYHVIHNGVCGYCDYEDGTFDKAWDELTEELHAKGLIS